MRIQLGRLAGALSALKQALALEPDNLAALLGIARIQLDDGDIDDAERLARTIAQWRTSDEAANAYLLLGMIGMRRGQLDAAESNLRESLALRPGNDQAQSLLALTLVESGRAAEAKSLLDQALYEHPQWIALLQASMKALQNSQAPPSPARPPAQPIQPSGGRWSQRYARSSLIRGNGINSPGDAPRADLNPAAAGRAATRPGLTSPLPSPAGRRRFRALGQWAE